MKYIYIIEFYYLKKELNIRINNNNKKLNWWLFKDKRLIRKIIK